MRIKKDVLTQKLAFVGIDSSDHISRKTALSSFTVYYSLNGGSATVMTTPTVAELDATNMAGDYTVLVDEAGMVSAAGELTLHITASGMDPATRVVEIIDNFEADVYTRVGTTGTGLSTVPWNPAWDVEVQSEVTDALAVYDPPTRAEATADKDEIIVDTTAIKAKTDDLPSGIAKNVALSKFSIYMVLSSDHVSAATGKTIVGEISKDGGAFATIANTITEISDGMYVIASGFTQSEMNADTIDLKFTETSCDQRIITIHTT